MRQMTLATGMGFEKHGRATRKAGFLARMETLVPWAEFCALIEPHYPKAGNGRPPVGLERMLRMYSMAVLQEDSVTDDPTDNTCSEIGADKHILYSCGGNSVLDLVTDCRYNGHVPSQPELFNRIHDWFMSIKLQN